MIFTRKRLLDYGFEGWYQQGVFEGWIVNTAAMVFVIAEIIVYGLYLDEINNWKIRETDLTETKYFKSLLTDPNQIIQYSTDTYIAWADPKVKCPHP